MIVEFPLGGVWGGWGEEWVVSMRDIHAFVYFIFGNHR